jgi:putative integral membrane protein (TIGR02587 family)
MASDDPRKTAATYARGLMGGMLIGAPVLMTMEVWWKGFEVPAWRLLLLYVVNYGILLILQHFSGLSHKKSFRAQAAAAVVALGIGTIASSITLFLLGVLRSDLQLRDVVGKLLLESIPVSIGASVAMSEFGSDEKHEEITDRRREEAGYFGSLGIAIAGSSLFAFGFAATEEPLMVADQLDAKRAIMLMALSILQVFAVLFAIDKKSGDNPKLGSREHVFAVMQEAVSTYAVALIMAGYFLWTFEILNSSVGVIASVYVVIAAGFMTSLGAAAGEVLI